MDASALTLRVFLSSPGDVGEERGIARKVMEQLEAGHLLKGKVRFEIVAWDDKNASAPMDARETPQTSVNRYTGRPSDCDLTLLILWSRLGTPLPPGVMRADGTRYESGTVWERDDALAGDKPIFIYRRTDKPKVDVDDPEFDGKRGQYEAVKGFFKRFTNPDGSLTAGFNGYASPIEFGTLLRQHLEAFVNERLWQGSTPTVAPDDSRVFQIATLIDDLARKNQQIDAKDAEIARLSRENEELRRAAIARTLTAAAQPDASKAAVAAADALEAGDPRPAEALLRTQERDEAAQIGSPDADDALLRREAAELAREQGALAMGHDVRAALAAYERAAEYDPDDTWTHFFVGDLHMRLGTLDAAMQSYERGAAETERRLQADPDGPDAQRDLSTSYNKIADALKAQGDRPGAFATYRKALAISEALAARDPTNTEWQRDLSVSHNKMGNMLVAQGDGPRALAAYRKGLAIREALAACDPANTGWQHDLSVSHNKIGDVLVAQGDGPGALASYRKALAISEALAARDPTNTRWRRDLSVSHNKIGDVLMVQGDGPGALTVYHKGLAIAEALAARDSANTRWQRDLSVSYDRIGDVVMAQGDGPGALTAYRKALAIREALVAHDPANTEWQRDLSASHIKIGDVLMAQGDGTGARAAHRKSNEIFAALAARDPANTKWQRDLAVSHLKIGEVLQTKGETLSALAAYGKSHDILQVLAASDPANAQSQYDLGISHERIGDVYFSVGDVGMALAHYCRKNQIIEALAARDPANAQWQTDLAVSCARLGTLAHGESVEARRNYLGRGRKSLVKLKKEERLLPNQDWIGWFDEQLAQLAADEQ